MIHIELVYNTEQFSIRAMCVMVDDEFSCWKIFWTVES